MKMFESSEELTDHLHRTIDSHFSKSTKLTKASFVASSYTISKEDKEAARLRGLPVIPVTPAPADPQRIKVSFSMCLYLLYFSSLKLEYLVYIVFPCSFLQAFLVAVSLILTLFSD